jgi:hypothetical protein
VDHDVSRSRILRLPSLHYDDKETLSAQGHETQNRTVYRGNPIWHSWAQSSAVDRMSLTFLTIDEAETQNRDRVELNAEHTKHTVVGRRKTTPSAKSHPGPYQACRLTFFTSTMAELQTDSSLYLDTIVLQVQ